MASPVSETDRSEAVRPIVMSGPGGSHRERARELAGSASARALVGSILGSGPGLLLPFVIAARFGVGRQTDAYFYAYGIALAAVTIQSATLEANTLPVARRFLAAGRRRFRGFLARTTVQAMVVALLVYGVITLIAVPIILSRSAWTAEQRRTALELLVAFAPLILAVSASSILDAALYATGEFFIPTVSVGARGLVPLVVVLVAHPSFHLLIILALALGAGEWLRWVIVLQRVLQRSRFLDQTGEVAKGSIWRAVGPHAMSLAMGTLNPIVDRTFASGLRAGSVTLVDLSEKILYLPLTALTASIVLVAGAGWARVLIEEPVRLGREFTGRVRQATVVSAAAATATGVAVTVVPLVIGREVDGVPALKLAELSDILLLGVCPAVAIFLASRLLTVTGATKWLPLLTLVYLVFNCGLDAVGVRVAGLFGIIAASTVGRAASCVAYMACALRVARSVSVAPRPSPLGIRLRPLGDSAKAARAGRSPAQMIDS